SWREGSLSQGQFCKENEYCISTFQYWLKKYREEYPDKKKKNKSVNKLKGFLPIEVSNAAEVLDCDSESFDIYYPNGVRLSCSASINTEALRTLINL
ncbi:hypothetical protein HNS40_22180, partial [Lentimicrobium sp. S6]|nr:hypothetical protein [Lentimicrobium sp. S6]